VFAQKSVRDLQTTGRRFLSNNREVQLMAPCKKCLDFQSRGILDTYSVDIMILHSLRGKSWQQSSDISAFVLR
jgi:hypothetical protein